MIGIHAKNIINTGETKMTNTTAQKTTRPSGKLKDFIAAGKNPSRVLGATERWLLAQPADVSRRSDVIHPSAMIKSDWCHRAEYYELQGVAPEPRQLTMKQMLTFEEGHRIHDRWQTTFGNMGKLWGRWRCLGCNFNTVGLKPSSCVVCFSMDMKYAEVAVESSEHGIAGHADGVLVGFGDPLLLEIKSVGEGTIRWEDAGFWLANDSDFKKAWANLKAPFYTHIMQAQVYMKCLEIMAEGTMNSYPKEAVFLYESKVDQEVKEFVVPKSDFGIMELFDAAALIVKAVADQTPLDCNINGAELCSKCKAY